MQCGAIGTEKDLARRRDTVGFWLTLTKGQIMSLKYLHTMVRVKDLDKTMAFFELLGLRETRRSENEGGRFTLIFMAAEGNEDCPVELTYNWDGDDGLPSDGRHFGHLAYATDDIYALCQKLMDNGVTINRPPRDGWMAFVRSPDNISVELLQSGDRKAPAEPWASMENTGHW
jgi:lactoylglutathione lyase